MASSALVELTAITKAFGGAKALDSVDLTLTGGSVHALVGENGAGKSTLVKVLTGALRPTSGTITVRGEPVSFGSPLDAQRRGVVAVYQEIEVLPHRTVAENLLLGREPRRWGFLDTRTMNEQAAALLEGLGLALDPRATLGELPIALRQMVGIARGAALASTVLVLDEPTSSLSASEIALLYALVERVKARGCAIVYISHRFDEIDAICDTVTVLRDGKHVSTSPLAGLERRDLVARMLGRPLEATFPPARDTGVAASAGPPLLRAEGLRRRPMLNGVSVDAHAGEIVGIAGLLGSGRTETLRVIFGADPRDGGTVQLAGLPADGHGPRDAIAAGIGLLSEDRKAEGIVPQLSVRENLTLAMLPRISRFGIVSRRREQELTDAFIARLGVKTRTSEQPIGELSGGNQQKVLLARWLGREPKLLLVDEPTRGIDIGAKSEIHTLLVELASTGVAILLVSSELDELVAASSRVVVLRDGRAVAELRGSDVAAGPIMHAIAGETP